MPPKFCRVMFTDPDGVVHSTQVQADGLYEAACPGLKALKRSDWIDVIGPGTRITIQVHEPLVEHFLMFAQLTNWLDGMARSLAEYAQEEAAKGDAGELESGHLDRVPTGYHS